MVFVVAALRFVLLICSCWPIIVASASSSSPSTTATLPPPPPPPSLVSPSASSYELTREQIQTYHRDGVIVIRGLLQGEQLENAIKAVHKLQRRKSLGQRLLYKLNPLYKTFEFQTWRKDPALESIAFDSCAPTICAQLMGLDKDVDRKDGCPKRPLRLLKDAVLGYSVGDKGCGWHVDDKMFWPCEDKNVGKRDAGINVWITLSPISIEEGGGLAVAPTSHRRWFARKARKLIASKGSQTTCALQTLAPDCHDKMEQLKMLYDLQPGDAIIHDRYIFHRAEPFVDHDDTTKAGSNTKQRISLRYVPADATYYGSEFSTDIVVEEKGLKTGDAISKGGEYFPQTWPTSLPEERNLKVLEDRNPFTLMKIYKMIRMQQQMKKKKQKEGKGDADNKTGGYV